MKQVSILDQPSGLYYRLGEDGKPTKDKEPLTFTGNRLQERIAFEDSHAIKLLWALFLDDSARFLSGLAFVIDGNIIPFTLLGASFFFGRDSKRTCTIEL